MPKPKEDKKRPGIAIIQGEVSEAQLEEIKQKQWRSVKDVATVVGYSTAWVSYLCKTGRVKAIKPVGGQWRIPESEYKRIIEEGLPPLPREKSVEKAVKELVMKNADITDNPPEKSKLSWPWNLLFKE